MSREGQRRRRLAVLTCSRITRVIDHRWVNIRHEQERVTFNRVKVSDNVDERGAVQVLSGHRQCQLQRR
jgi:hypothetical protein